MVRTDDGALSLLVDEIGDVIEVEEKTFEQPPETLKGMAREMIRGVVAVARAPAAVVGHRTCAGRG